MRDARLAVLVGLAVLPYVAHAGETVTGVPAGVNLAELGSISWPAAIAWLAYLLRQWEPRIHVVHEKDE